jgi:F-type H+-transporting ATPase subunit a
MSFCLYSGAMLGEKTTGKWTMDQAPQYAIDHVANSPKNLFEFEILDNLSQKISSFLGISSDSLFYIDLGITKHVFLLFFVSLITVTTIVTLIQKYISNKKNIPSKFMSIIEMFVIYLRDDVLKNFIGDKEYRSWAPLVYTIFFFILFGNLLGLVPIFDLFGLVGKISHIDSIYIFSKGGNTVTANVNVTFAIATITFCAFIFAGIKKYGFIQHWKNLAPSGLPWPLYFVVVPIEFMGLFIRPLALTLRLAGNMMGGHIALVIFITFIFSATAEIGGLAGLGIAPFSVSLALGLTMLELLVAVIQAYVFALLTAVFIGMAIHVDH